MIRLSLPRHARQVALGMLLASLFLCLLGLGIGSSGIEWGGIGIFDGRNTIVWHIRLPRSLGAWVAGALLGLAGAVAQGLFRNPLADPYLLGSASGSALGVSLVLVWLGASSVSLAWLPLLGVAGGAFLGALGGVLLSLVLARGVQHTLHLLLAGVVVGVVLEAIRSMILLAHPELLQSLQFFSLGSTGWIGWESLLLMAGGWLFLISLAWWISPVLDGLVLGEATAFSLGLPLRLGRWLLIIVLAGATGLAVAQTGLIGFVGLVAPHCVRPLHLQHGGLVLLSSLCGGLLLLTADLLARGLRAPEEIPLGVLTAFLGGGYMLSVLWRRYRISG